MVEVKFLDCDDDSQIASIKYEHFENVLIPDFKPEKHSVFLRQTFVGREASLWQIQSLSINKLSVSVSLKELDSPKSLGQFALEQRKKPATILRRDLFQLVEVEFGYQQDHLDTNGDRKRNEIDPLALMPGEMHKKRPCIVVTCEDDKVQVIPLTSQRNNSNPRKLEISQESFTNLSTRYTEKNSFGLISMMQTVSAFRVYPMKNAHGRYDYQFQKAKLAQSDKDSLKNQLGKLYAASALNDYQNEVIRRTKLSEEKGKLLAAIQRLNQSSSELSEANNDNVKALEQIANFFDISWTDHDDLRQSIIKAIQS